MFLFKNSLLPQSFDNYYLRINEVHNYNTRRSRPLFYVPFCRTKIRQFSVIYQGLVFFNSLNVDIQEALTINLLQSKLKNIFSRL